MMEDDKVHNAPVQAMLDRRKAEEEKDRLFYLITIANDAY
jgi:hypothetical protein